MESDQNRNDLLDELQVLEHRIHQIKQQLGLAVSDDALLRPQLPSGITLRKDGRYVARFMFQGKTYTLYGRDPYLLKKRLEQLRSEVHAGHANSDHQMNLDQWFFIWMEHYKYPFVKPTTCQVYQGIYQKHIGPALGYYPLMGITAHMLQNLLNEISGRVSPRTASGVYVVLDMILEQACKNDLISQNPLKKTTFIHRTVREEQRVLTREEQQIFMKFADDDPYKRIFLLAIHTGMRNGELRALEWADLNLEKRMIHVRGTLSYLNQHYYKAIPKSQSGRRDIPMTEPVYQLFLEQKQEQLLCKNRMSDQWQPISGLENLVFTTLTGSCLSQNLLCDHIRKIEKRIRQEHPEWKSIHFHTLRHTFATRAIEGGMEPQTLKSILGHASLAMTMDLYSHVLPDTKASQMHKIECMF